MLLAVLAATLLSLVVAPGAVAHTSLTATTPANDAVLGTSPALVTLRFSEPVETAFGSVRVYDGEARRVDDGRTIRPSPDELAVGVDRELPKGTYTVAWRVVSADAHPVHGAFVFHVGRPGVDAGGVADELLDADAGSRAVSWSFGVVRFLGFAFILLTAGGGAALAIWVPERDDVATARRRLWLTVAGASLALATVTLAAIGLQGASAAGQGLHGAVRWSLVQDVVETRFGEVALARVVLAAAIAVLAVVASRHTGRTEQRLSIAACSLGALVAATPALSGHAHPKGSLAVLADAVHVEAASIWAGGLTFVLLLLLWVRGRRWEVATEAVPAFSSVAVVAVAALIVAGSVSAFLEVRSVPALWETAYGRLLLLKVVLVVPVLALGAFNNRTSVPRLGAGTASAQQRRRFLLGTVAELTIVVVVLAVTAGLVEQPPPQPGLLEEGDAQVRAAYGANYERLVALENAYDPDNLFRLNGNIAPSDRR